MEEWKEYKLGDLYDVHNGLSKGGKFFGSGYPFLSFKTVFNNYFLPPVLPDMVQSNEKEQGGYDIKRGDVFVTRTSETPEELGMSSVALKDYPFATYNGFTKRLRPKDTSIIYPEFIGYYLRSTKFRALFYGLASSMSTRASLANGDLLGMKVFLPAFATQEKIAKILKSLDDKIEVNRKINENLEQQAQALFKSWFVDFEPFKNGEFVESELGMIPKGWRVDRIEDVSQKMASGGTPKSLNKDYYSGNIKWFSTKELKDCFLFDSEKHISEDALNNSSAKMFPEGTVLMAIYAAPTVGRLGILTSSATFNQAAVGIVPKENVGSEFVYLSLLSERTNLNNLASGAAQQNLNVGIVKNYIILVPEQKILDRFNRIVKGVFNLLKKNSDESRRLAELRDTLLPKLMSGELKVNDLA